MATDLKTLFNLVLLLGLGRVGVNALTHYPPGKF